MTNLTDVAVDSLTIGTIANPYPTSATLAATGNITLKSGVVTLTNASAPVVATLALPVATTDDFKELIILSTTAQAHTVACASGTFGSSGAGYTTVTFTAIEGANLHLFAYQGRWYILHLNAAAIA